MNQDNVIILLGAKKIGGALTVNSNNQNLLIQETYFIINMARVFYFK